MSSRPSPLPNRVTPFGEIVADPARGMFMGNRGGKLHENWHITRKQASRRWIACLACFRGRRRRVMETGYTELFFLDEATALAAGHRPCFECRRAAARAFADAMGETRADAIDRRLTAERLRPAPLAAEELVDGVMVAAADGAHLFADGGFRRWSFAGYGPKAATPPGPLLRLTPASTVAALRAGYRPALHASALR